MPNRSEDMTNPEEITPLQPAELLLSISKRVAAYETLDDMLKILVDMVTEEIAADRATIFLNDPDTG